MKQIRFFLIGLVSVFSLEIHAQEPILFEGRWILESLFIDGETFFPPSNPEVQFIDLLFEEDNGNLDTIIGCVCDCFAGEVTFQEGNGSPPTFIIANYTETLGGCFGSDEEVAENTDFQNRYFTFYESSIADPFEYIIVFLGDNVSLEVYSSSGDVAIYGNPSLSVQDFITPTVSIFPNPIEDVLNITSDTAIGAYRMTIFDLYGRKVSISEIASTNHEIHTQDWGSGIYLLQIERTNGITTTKKLIKK